MRARADADRAQYTALRFLCRVASTQAGRVAMCRSDDVLLATQAAMQRHARAPHTQEQALRLVYRLAQDDLCRGLVWDTPGLVAAIMAAMRRHVRVAAVQAKAMAAVAALIPHEIWPIHSVDVDGAVADAVAGMRAHVHIADVQLSGLRLMQAFLSGDRASQVARQSGAVAAVVGALNAHHSNDAAYGIGVTVLDAVIREVDAVRGTPELVESLTAGLALHGCIASDAVLPQWQSHAMACLTTLVKDAPGVADNVLRRPAVIKTVLTAMRAGTRKGDLAGLELLTALAHSPEACMRLFDSHDVVFVAVRILREWTFDVLIPCAAIQLLHVLARREPRLRTHIWRTPGFARAIRWHVERGFDQEGTLRLLCTLCEAPDVAGLVRADAEVAVAIRRMHLEWPSMRSVTARLLELTHLKKRSLWQRLRRATVLPPLKVALPPTG